VTVEDAETPELRSLAERAARRQQRWFSIVVLIGLLSGVLGGIAASRFGHRDHAQHHALALAVVALLGAAVILIAEGGLFYWLVRRRKGMFRDLPLVLGLPWRDRRAVAKAVRRGQPPPDALRRTVGRQMAERILRYRQLAQASYLILALAQTMNALLPYRPPWFRYLSAASAVAFLCGLIYLRAMTAGARRYLERCTDRPDEA
jgi:MFS family permease